MICLLIFGHQLLADKSVPANKAVDLVHFNEDMLVGLNDIDDAVGANVVNHGQARTMPVSRQRRQYFIWPVGGQITSHFGHRWGRLHAGIDIANDPGTLVRASEAGWVRYSGWQNGYGLMVIIDHGNGLSTVYGHLSERLVNYNEIALPGQIIGLMGNTGNSEGPHLHFEVRQNDTPLNPLTLLP